MKNYLMMIVALNLTFDVYASNDKVLSLAVRQQQIDEMLTRADVRIQDPVLKKLIEDMSPCIQPEKFEKRIDCMNPLVNGEIAKVENQRNFRVAVILFVLSCCVGSGSHSYDR